MTDLLHIERLSCVYRVPRDHPAPEAVRSSLDEIAREGVARECARAISAVLDPDDPSVWVIDQLDVNFTLDIGMTRKPDVASLWASRIAGSLGRTVANGPDESAGVRRFASRAEFLAWLLGDLLAGRQWTSHHTREFEGLRPLTLSGLIAEALAREPYLAERILFALVRAGALTRLIEALTPLAALRILAVCAPDADDDLIDRDLWSLVLDLSHETLNPLGIYLRCRADEPAAVPGAVRAAAERCVQFHHALEDGQVRDALAAGDFSRALKLSRVENRQALLLLYSLAAGDNQWLRESVKAAPAGTDPGDAFDSEFGGVFLLLPDYLVLYPESSPLFRYIVLLKCLGRDVAPMAWRDPALLLASGLEELPTLDEIRDCRPARSAVAYSEGDLSHFSLDRLLMEEESNDAASRAALQLTRKFARRLMGLERSSPAYLFRNVIGGPATIRKTSEGIVVRLRPRPLQIVLRMAGLNSFNFVLPWLPDTEILIELPDE